jgi:hypothetical protein
LNDEPFGGLLENSRLLTARAARVVKNDARRVLTIEN